MENWNIVERPVWAWLKRRNKAGLPLPSQKTLVNVAFELSGRKDFEASDFYKNECFMTENQYYIAFLIHSYQQFSCLEQVSTLFEFNSPISKKEGWISKDFEKNCPDFERFRMDFESCRHLLGRDFFEPIKAVTSRP